MIQPPQRLDVPPPVLFGCTRTEIGVILALVIGSGLALLLLTWPLLWQVMDSGLSAFVVALFVAVMGTLLSGWLGIRTLGALKSRRSPEWFDQRLERIKQQIGLGHPKLVVRSGPWHNLR
ncbi:MAG: DUF3487 family protein [Pseudomonadota bacterium]